MCINSIFSLLVIFSVWTAATLLVCTRWLLRQCGRPQTECRHTCMNLVFNLAPSVKGKRYVTLFAYDKYLFAYDKLLFELQKDTF